MSKSHFSNNKNLPSKHQTPNLITLVLPDPKQYSLLSCLHQVHAGIQRTYTLQSNQRRIRLPIILHQLYSHWDQTTIKHRMDAIMLWAVASHCFFFFFHLGKIMIPPYNIPLQQLALGDVAVDNRVYLTVQKVYLKRSN